VKVIYPDNITQVLASEENASFPIENVSDDHIKKVWKANSNDAVINASVSGGSAVALYGTNATSVTVKTRTGGMGGAWGGTGAMAGAWGGTGDMEGAWTTESLSTETVKFDTLPTDQAALWCDFTDPGSAFALEVTLSSAAGSTLQVGVLRSGTVRDFKDAKYGIKEGFIDYSVREELANGAWYYLKRDIIRTFTLTLQEDRASDFYIFMHNVALLRGQQPLAWRLSEKITDWQWIVYAALDGMPMGDHTNITDSLIQIKLKEVV